MNKIFDTHSHYNLAPLTDNWREHLAQARSVGVERSVVVGTDTITSVRALELSFYEPDFFLSSVGLHPDVISQQVLTQPESERRRVLAQIMTFFLHQVDEGKLADAWGELGLDFYHADRESADWPQLVDYQLELLRGQLIIAAGSDLPLIFHVRDTSDHLDDPEGAYWQLIREIDAHHRVADKKLIFHCFSGSERFLARVLEYPHSYVSFAGNVTFKSAEQLRSLLAKVPVERLLLETDCPYLSPEPQRGQVCEPAFIVHTAEYVQTQLGVDLAQVYQNSLAIFTKSEV